MARTVPPFRTRRSTSSVPSSHELLFSVTSGDDTTARSWNPLTGMDVQVLQGHTEFVAPVEFSADGTLVLTGSSDGTVRLWDAQTGAEVQTFARHTAPVRYAVFSSDGTYLLTTSEDGTARLWRVR